MCSPASTIIGSLLDREKQLDPRGLLRGRRKALDPICEDVCTRASGLDGDMAGVYIVPIQQGQRRVLRGGMRGIDRRTGPLYRRVADDISEQIEQGQLQPGDKLPSERALCDQYGVSQITVRRALRELRHDDLLFSRHGLGWYVNEEASTVEAAGDVALVFSEMDSLLSSVVRPIAGGLESNGLSLRLFCPPSSEDGLTGALTLAQSQGAAALLLAPAGDMQGMAEQYSALNSGSTPALLLVREIADAKLPAVVLDEQACMAKATEHLVDLGHSALCYLGAEPTTLEGQQRYWGFANALWDHEMDLPLDWVITTPYDARETWEALRTVFRNADRPTALVCSDDLRAAQAMSVLSNMGLRCPMDVAIVSMGDRDFAAALSTPLTTVRFDLEGFARAAVNMTVDLVAGRAVETARVSGRITFRQSCGSALPGPHA